MAREYAKVGPQFWNGRTGKALKREGSEAVIVAMYLMTCQHANMLGLYFLSLAYVAHDTGLGFEGASKGLEGACKAGFCQYDIEAEVVWVMEMAVYQIGDRLDAKDNRCKGVQREYDALPENKFLTLFFERYGEVFGMTSCRDSKPEEVVSQAPPKPLRSQEREQEQEHEQEMEQEQDGAAGAGKPAAFSQKSVIAEGVDATHLKDWIKARKSPLTETAWIGLKTEAAKAGISPAEAVRICAVKGWRGFDSTWNWRSATTQVGAPSATDQRDAEAMRLLGFGQGEYIDA